jgi:hypothetical protein
MGAELALPAPVGENVLKTIGQCWRPGQCVPVILHELA